jgi:ppGpp synthetase/RelA/SpoT-type nucleotidyltranferase
VSDEEITRAAWSRYSAEATRLELIADELETRLSTVAAAEKTGAHVSSRVKTPRSYLRKLNNPAKRSAIWPHVDDLVGARVCVDSLRELRALTNKLQHCDFLTKVRVERKTGKPDQLYYPGTHIVATFTPLALLDGSQLRCEIQLRTKAQDAWSSVSHKLAYKAGIKPSARALRRINRLVALMEVFDDEIDALLRQRDRNASFATIRAYETVEEEFARLTGSVPAGSPDLSLLSALETLYSAAERATLGTLIEQYVGVNETSVRGTLDRLNSGRVDFDGSRDWLALQPESLVVLERANSRLLALATWATGTSLEEPIRALVHAAGRDWPLDD